jgi:hypothetical protein
MLICLFFVNILGMLEQSPSVADILESWEEGCKTITSYNLTIESTNYSYVNVDAKGNAAIIPDVSNVQPRRSESKLYRSNEMRKCEFQMGNGGDMNTTIIQTTNRSLVLNRQAKKATIKHSILSFGRTENDDYEATYRTILGSIDRIAISRLRECRLLPRQGGLFVLDVPFAKEKNSAFFNFCWQVSLDPDRNFMPVRIVSWYDQNGNKQLSSTTDNILKEVVPGVWMPEVSTTKLYYKGEPTDPMVGKLIGTDIIKILELISVNEAIDPNQFKVDIPNGFTVTDETRNITYVEGSSDPDRYLAQLAKDTSEGLKNLPKTERGMPKLIIIPDSWWSRHRYQIYGLVVICSIVTFLALAIRNRKH